MIFKGGRERNLKVHEIKLITFEAELKKLHICGNFDDF
jgi:hypothetical protein